VKDNVFESLQHIEIINLLVGVNYASRSRYWLLVIRITSNPGEIRSAPLKYASHFTGQAFHGAGDCQITIAPIIPFFQYSLAQTDLHGRSSAGDASRILQQYQLIPGKSRQSGPILQLGQSPKLKRR